MWSDPGHRAASLPSPCPQSPSQPQQLSLQPHPKITRSFPSTATTPQTHGRHIPARGAASAASLGTTALPFAAGMLTEEERLGMQGMQAARRGGAVTTHGPSKEGCGRHSTHSCLRDPSPVQVTRSPLQCSHLAHPPPH